MNNAFTLLIYQNGFWFFSAAVSIPSIVCLAHYLTERRKNRTLQEMRDEERKRTDLNAWLEELRKSSTPD